MALFVLEIGMHRKLPYKAILLALLGSSCLFTLTGFFGEANWLFDLTSHFRLQYAIILFVALGYFTFTGKTIRDNLLRKVLPLSLLLLINLSQIVPFYLPEVKVTGPPLSKIQTISILHLNVLLFNPNHKAVTELIRDKNADIVSLQEVWEDWEPFLDKSPVLKKYPYRVIHSKSGNRLYSKYPLSNTRIIPVTETRLRFNWKSAIIATQIENTHIYAFHPPVPVLPAYAQTMENYLKAMEKALKTNNGPAIVIGDFNTTPWSANYRQLTQEMQLKDSRIGFGLHSSWPTFFPPFYIPIDYVLASPEIETLKYETGSFVGSDHLPVYVELGLPED